MLCYQITVNEERAFIVGAENMPAVRLFLIDVANGEGAQIIVDGNIVQSERLSETYRWLERELHQNDEIRIKLVESNSPDRPESVKSYGTKTDETGTKQLFCSFCGQSQEQVEKIVAGFQGNICSECFKLTAEIFSEKA